MGLGTIGGGFSKMDGVPVELVESQWGCPESQWDRVSMGILQGGRVQFSYVIKIANAGLWSSHYL